MAKTKTENRRVHRIEVWHEPGHIDPQARELLREAHDSGIDAAEVRVARVYLIDAVMDKDQANQIAEHLLADPVTQRATVGSDTSDDTTQTVEIHYLPGVMDPVAQTTAETIRQAWPDVAEASGEGGGGSGGDGGISVKTGYRYDVLANRGKRITPDDVRRLAERLLANPVVQSIHDRPYHPDRLDQGRSYKFDLIHVPILDLDDAGLKRLSREAHLFLDLNEMQAIQAYYQSLKDGPREPTDIELETLAQTWSEHCVHKTLKATIRYTQGGAEQKPGDPRGLGGLGDPGAKDWAKRPGHHLESDGSIVITNLLKSTIAAATRELMEQPHFQEWCVSVFEDNAGIVRLDDTDGVCIKVETHNHPSALEPYGGAATGIGGCIRDIMGTGLSAKPIASTNVFCVAHPQRDRPVPKGVIHPKRVLQQVVGGIRDYGNRIGVPTVNGAVWFDDRYVGNPLVFAGCIGLIPLGKCFGEPRAGDRIVVLGGKTGRDGIHGATFSSAELTDTHADEFSHAVQIGNPITQKKTLDVILEARDEPGGPLFRAITDCGAGGFSSAVGEMGEKLGASVTLETAPLKYDGLTYTEIWISEAQERMVLAVPPEKMRRLSELCTAQDVQMCDLGSFGCDSDDGQPQLLLTFEDHEVGRLSMRFLHEGLPTPTRAASWSPPVFKGSQQSAGFVGDVTKTLYALLKDPNIASKHWIIRQYDHEVQGGSVVKPLVGPGQDGPSDAAVVRPKPDSHVGIAISCGLQTGMGEDARRGSGDSYWMALAAIDEAIRNCVCVGANPDRIALLDNFCWPSCDTPRQLGALVRAAEACYDGAMAYQAPFVSGKDSLNNQFVTDGGELIAIPPTLLITALGIVGDVRLCRTMDGKSAGNVLIAVGKTDAALGGSHLLRVMDFSGDGLEVPRVDLKVGPATSRAVASLIEQRLVASAHDCSDGGLLVAAAEMAFSGRVGLTLDLDGLGAGEDLSDLAVCFSETPSRYLLEVRSDDVKRVLDRLQSQGVPAARVGVFDPGNRLQIQRRERVLVDESLDNLRTAWREPLDW